MQQHVRNGAWDGGQHLCPHSGSSSMCAGAPAHASTKQPLPAVAGETYAGPAMKYDLPQKGVMAATADSSGKTLGQLAGDGGRGPAQQDARAAAAAAALQRSGQAQSASPAPAAPQQQQQSQQSYKKGDAVLYRQRDGSWVEAKVGVHAFWILHLADWGLQ